MPYIPCNEICLFIFCGFIFLGIPWQPPYNVSKQFLFYFRHLAGLPGQRFGLSKGVCLYTGHNTKRRRRTTVPGARFKSSISVSISWSLMKEFRSSDTPKKQSFENEVEVVNYHTAIFVLIVINVIRECSESLFAV